jgi:hypothetical protein
VSTKRILIASLLGSILGIVGYSTWPGDESPEGSPVPAPVVVAAVAKPPSPEAEAAWEKIRPHLKEADEASADAVVKAAQRINDFFDSRYDRSLDFAEESLSLTSKWRLIKSRLPGTDAEGHREFLRERFEAVVFSRKELAGVIESAVEEFVQAIRGIENALLVKARADIGDDDLSPLRNEFAFRSDEAFRREYAKSLQGVADIAGKDLGVAVGREVVSWVAADMVTGIGVSLTTKVATRLGISAAILGSGVGSAVATLGVGLVAGVVIDMLIDWVLKEVGYDPVGDLRDETEVAIYQFEEVLVFGSVAEPVPPKKLTSGWAKRFYELQMRRWNEWKRRNPDLKDDAGFMWELRQYCLRRGRLRNEALRQMIVKEQTL